MARAISFSLYLRPWVPGSWPPWPASMTTLLILNSLCRMELAEFSKVIARKIQVIPIFLTVSSMFRQIAITLRKFVKFSLKRKKPAISRSVPRFFFLFFLLSLSAPLRAQVETTIRDPGELPAKADTLIASDTIPTDTTAVRRDTTITQANSDIETTIRYSARDSIRASIDGKKIWLYGQARITYGEIQLEAEEIIIDYDKGTLTAHGRRDSTGQRIGFPVFQDGSDLYETKDIVYNYRTGRARISEVVTKQVEGIVHVQHAFKNEKDELFSVNNAYTTCDLEHPHFVIRSTKSKSIPRDKIISGP